MILVSFQRNNNIKCRLFCWYGSFQTCHRKPLNESGNEIYSTNARYLTKSTNGVEILNIICKVCCWCFALTTVIAILHLNTLSVRFFFGILGEHFVVMVTKVSTLAKDVCSTTDR